MSDIGYVLPSGTLPHTYPNIQQKNNDVKTTTTPINSQNILHYNDISEWTDYKKEQAEIELQEAQHFFDAMRKVIRTVQEEYQKQNKTQKSIVWQKTKDVLADKWDYFYNQKYKNDTQEKDCCFNKKISRNTALISRDVYNDEQKEINGYKPVDKLEDPETGLRVVAYKKKNDIIIAYCGTNDSKDFLSDAQMAMNEVPDQFEKANQFYLDTVQKNPKASVILTGHSLGGSLAQLVASRNKSACAITFNAFGIHSIIKNKDKKDNRVFQDNKNSFNYVIMGDPVSNSTKHVGITTRLHKNAINNHSIANYINMWV